MQMAVPLEVLERARNEYLDAVTELIALSKTIEKTTITSEEQVAEIREEMKDALYRVNAAKRMLDRYNIVVD